MLCLETRAFWISGLWRCVTQGYDHVCWKIYSDHPRIQYIMYQQHWSGYQLITFMSFKTHKYWFSSKISLTLFKLILWAFKRLSTWLEIPTVQYIIIVNTWPIEVLLFEKNETSFLTVTSNVRSFSWSSGTNQSNLKHRCQIKSWSKQLKKYEVPTRSMPHTSAVLVWKCKINGSILRVVPNRLQSVFLDISTSAATTGLVREQISSNIRIRKTIRVTCQQVPVHQHAN